MGNYRQHLGFASVLGVGYAACAYVGVGVHWVYGSVAALLATVGGLLPDLDSPTGVEMRNFTGLLGILAAIAAWGGMAHLRPPPVFEMQIWGMVGAYVFTRHGVKALASRLAVHRGMSHSFPTCGVWGALTYLYYPSDDHTLRMVMAAAVMVGFLSHLLLDEICSVDLRGARVNKAFGTALKFWAPSASSTFLVYAALSLLTWQVLEAWPEEPFALRPPRPPMIPYLEHARQVREFAVEVARSPAVQKRLDGLKAVEPELRRAAREGADALRREVRAAHERAVEPQRPPSTSTPPSRATSPPPTGSPRPPPTGQGAAMRRANLP